MRKYSPKIAESVGTTKIVIGRKFKMGSNSLDRLVENYNDINYFNGLYSNGDITIPQKILEYGGEHNSQMSVVESLDNQVNDFIYIVLLRDVKDRWRSGYIEELHTFGFFSETHEIGDMELWEKVHHIDYDISWMWSGHASFEDNSLDLEYSIWNPCVYFLDLKNLSNPKFLEWLQERDSGWNGVKSIEKDNVAPTWKRELVENYWIDYRADKVSKESLVCPLYTTSHNKSRFDISHVMDRADRGQRRIDFIRERHERYIRL
jgi:hypothetical protein